MDERAVEAAIRTLGKELTDIKNAIRDQNSILRKIVDHQGRLVAVIEKKLEEEKIKEK